MRGNSCNAIVLVSKQLLDSPSDQGPHSRLLVAKDVPGSRTGVSKSLIEGVGPVIGPDACERVGLQRVPEIGRLDCGMPVILPIELLR